MSDVYAERQAKGETTAASAAIAQLVAEGVTTVFTIPGVHNVHMVDALLDFDSLNVVGGRNEQELVFMANGYTRASGEIAVPLVISGPGVTNSLTPLADARSDSVPMVLVAASCDTRYLGRGAFHELEDQSQALASVCKWNARVTDADQVPEVIHKAFEVAINGRPGPTAVEIPVDVQMEPTAESTVARALRSRPGAPAEQLQQAVEMISASTNTVFYLGSGTASSGAERAIADLLELLDAPFITTHSAKGVVGDRHPLSAGCGLQSEAARKAITQASVLVVVGSSLDESSTALWQLQLPSQVIHLDIDEAIVGRHYPALPLVGDARTVIEELAGHLRDRTPDLDKQQGFDHVSGARRAAEIRAARLDERTDESLGRAFMQAIDATLDDDSIVTNDASQVNAWAIRYLTRHQPRTFNITSNLGALGYAAPAALGASIAMPDRKIVALMGDGGFLFNPQCLGTAAQYNLPVAMVVFNDNAYSSIRATQQELFGRTLAVDLRNPDFAQLATSFGVRGLVVDTPHDLESALNGAWAARTPHLIEVTL